MDIQKAIFLKENVEGKINELLNDYIKETGLLLESIEWEELCGGFGRSGITNVRLDIKLPSTTSSTRKMPTGEGE